jgi:hypothetical protein
LLAAWLGQEEEEEQEEEKEQEEEEGENLQRWRRVWGSDLAFYAACLRA